MEQPNAKAAKVAQKPQKYFRNFPGPFCDFCEVFAAFAFGC
jgi:hypothetical protein